MLFKCRFCGSLADDGDIKNCICLSCIDDYLVGYLTQLFLLKKCVSKSKKFLKQIKEVK